MQQKATMCPAIISQNCIEGWEYAPHCKVSNIYAISLQALEQHRFLIGLSLPSFY